MDTVGGAERKRDRESGRRASNRAQGGWGSVWKRVGVGGEGLYGEIDSALLTPASETDPPYLLPPPRKTFHSSHSTGLH